MTEAETVIASAEAWLAGRPASPEWVGQFDADDLRTMLVELRAAVGLGEDPSELVVAWRATAEALSDPEGRDILLGRYDEGDFIEVDFDPP